MWILSKKKKNGKFPTFGNKLGRFEKSQNLSVFFHLFWELFKCN